MSEFKLRFEHVASVPTAEVSEKGIIYGKHDFNAKVTIKNPDTGKDQEVTVTRRAEREWMLGGGNWWFVTSHSAIIFNLDHAILKAKAEELQAFLFPKVPA
jgi:hypothetical protein